MLQSHNTAIASSNETVRSSNSPLFLYNTLRFWLCQRSPLGNAQATHH
jgi:hypothetical protein